MIETYTARYRLIGSKVFWGGLASRRFGHCWYLGDSRHRVSWNIKASGSLCTLGIQALRVFHAFQAVYSFGYSGFSALPSTRDIQGIWKPMHVRHSGIESISCVSNSLPIREFRHPGIEGISCVWSILRVWEFRRFGSPNSTGYPRQLEAYTFQASQVSGVFHACQALYAFGTSGIQAARVFRALQAYLLMQFRHNDYFFIYSEYLRHLKVYVG